MKVLVVLNLYFNTTYTSHIYYVCIILHIFILHTYIVDTVYAKTQCFFSGEKQRRIGLVWEIEGMLSICGRFYFSQKSVTKC